MTDLIEVQVLDCGDGFKEVQLSLGLVQFCLLDNLVEQLQFFLEVIISLTWRNFQIQLIILRLPGTFLENLKRD